MVERRHPVHDFIAAAPWPSGTVEQVAEIKAIYGEKVGEGDRLGRSVAMVMMMESIGFSSHLMQVAQRIPNSQARLLFTLTSGRMGGAFGNAAYAYLNADHIHRTGKPLPIPEEVKAGFDAFVDNAARSVGVNPDDHEGQRLAHEIDMQMTDQALARMVPTVTTLEFIDRYTELALNRLEDDDFNAPPREGFRKGRERFHELFKAAQTELGLT